MIERHWKGIARAIAGFIRSSILYRPVDKGTEFLIITVWESLDAIRQFAGMDTEEAVIPIQPKIPYLRLVMIVLTELGVNSLKEAK